LPTTELDKDSLEVVPVAPEEESAQIVVKIPPTICSLAVNPDLQAVHVVALEQASQFSRQEMH